MRKYIYNIAIVVFILIYLPMTGCKKDFLEVVPKGYLVATTYDDYRLLMNSSLFYQYNLGGGWQAAALMGDEVGAEESLYNIPYFFTPAHLTQAKGMFQWDDNVFLSTDMEYGGGFTAYFLKNIYTCNKIINDIPSATGGTDQQKAAIAAEAKAMRAFIYFQLINYYAKPYVASSASSDPGFPIMTTADITMKNLKRNTVQEVYDFIIKDMTDALPSLALDPLVVTHMNKAGVEGLLGKVYLSMNRYSQALTQFKLALADAAAMKTPPALYDYNTTLMPGGSFLPVDPANGPQSPFNNETDFKESIVATMFQGGTTVNGYGTHFLVMTPQTMSLYDPADFRLNFYSRTTPTYATYPNGRVRKVGVNYVRFGLELPDLLLLSAECKARSGDLTGAATDAETLRRKRMPVAVAAIPAQIAGNQLSLIKYILDERIREFAGTGYRWFDMRRLANDPLFSGGQAATHTLFLINGGTTTFTLRSARLTLKLPPSFIEQNPGMVNNP